MARLAGTHWLRENQLTRSPKRVLVVDTETRLVGPLGEERQQLRLWAARLTRRQGIDPKRPRTEEYQGTTASELVDLVEAQARADASLWLMTHNLNFDLAVTQLPVLLTARGWRLTEGALTTADPWCRFVKGRRRLTIADTWSYMPTSVEALGELLGVQKLPLPSQDASDAVWLARCQRDVDITARSIEQLMSWWDAGQFGNWSLTGPATGWSSYRHQRPRPRVLVEPDPQARELEQRAVTGGRRGVTQLGHLPMGLYADLDMTTAHLTVMGNYLLPARRLRAFTQLDPGAHVLHSQALDVLAECVVRTSSPRYPWNTGRGLFYPTGTFTTVLAGPEIRAALERDELVSIGRGYVYLLGNHMQQWAHWLAELLDDANTTTPPTARLAAKHWSRCVPGKWAGHTSEVISRTPDPRPGWALERGFLARDKRPADFLLIGGELWTIRRDDWAEDAFPAILAWIQSHTRLALSRLIDLAGPSWRVANTDGILVNVHQLAQGALTDSRPSAKYDQEQLQWLASWCQAASQALAPFVVRPKGAARSVTVISPQHLLLDQERRLAGVPRSAIALGGRRYSFTAWPKLRLQLIRQSGPGYLTDQREVNLEHIPPAGWLTAAGDVVPATVQKLELGELVQAPTWDQSQPGSELAATDLQHPVLRHALRTYGWVEADPQRASVSA